MSKKFPDQDQIDRTLDNFDQLPPLYRQPGDKAFYCEYDIDHAAFEALGSIPLDETWRIRKLGRVAAARINDYHTIMESRRALRDELNSIFISTPY